MRTRLTALGDPAGTPQGFQQANTGSFMRTRLTALGRPRWNTAGVPASKRWNVGFTRRKAMSKSRMLWAAVLALGLLPGGAWVLARQSGAVKPLTEKDQAEIRDLVARYAQALGGCQDAEYASLFTPDGTFTSDDFRGKKHREMYGAKGGTLKGRTQIAELVRTEEFCMEGTPRSGARGTNRPTPTVEIKAAPGGATGTAPLGGGGRYDDVYVKTAEGWRFKSRTVTMPPLAGAPASSSSQPAGGSFTTSDGVRLHYSDNG